ncbi:MAG: spore protease YyaC [Peptococcaceae bacterium]|nr:spore protease YyaC [Peptococcaceae bacterium]
MQVTPILYNERNAYLRISEAVLLLLPPQAQQVVTLCIGTDRVTGDAYGPLVGTFLQGFGLKPLGTLEQPVHAGNLTDYVAKLGPESFVLAIDACLGSLNSIGQINFKHGSLVPGAGVGKKLDSVGDASITMTVNVAGFMENLVLANTRLALVYAGAQTTALGIYRALSIRGLLPPRGKYARERLEGPVSLSR